MSHKFLRRKFLKSAVLGGAIPGLSARISPKSPQVSSFVPEAAKLHTTDGVATYHRLKAYLDSIPAIDTHNHLHPFDQMPGLVETHRGRGLNLYSLWNGSYLARLIRLTHWQPGKSFDSWWEQAKDDFINVRATGFYRYMVLSFQALYGVDFDRISDEQARELDDRIFENYRNQKWLYHVLTERANIELMLVDPFWARLDFRTAYPFQVLVFNVTTLIDGFHESEFQGHPWDRLDDPYEFARQQGWPSIASLTDYLMLLDRMFATAKDRGAVCLKSTAAYQRTLQFDDVSIERAARAFGRPRSDLTSQDVKAFEDFIMWRLVELSAKYELPFQFHTGDARIQDSNPMFLVNLIDANPQTKFVLFHGGFPWIGETGAIVQKYPDRVWIDSVWLPTISYTMAKNAYREWLEIAPLNRILWGADGPMPEGIFGATDLNRRCLAEVLAEKVDRCDLPEWYVQQIGKQVLRDNALELFPTLKKQLWKDRRPEGPLAMTGGARANLKFCSRAHRP